MRLIEARTLVDEQRITFKEFYGSNIPDYAILSHTWDQDQTKEVTYDDCIAGNPSSGTGYDKIHNTCELALDDGIEYVWIDTCCINKSSSAELTEAINSMFPWYQQATVCYAHLADLDGAESMKSCRWFSRGWTLQELIAPKSMAFYDRSWTCVGSKTSLIYKLSAITGIDVDILSHDAPLSSTCIAKRLSWAAKRETTRVEDMAYCLLGICNINMPMLYGEGNKAFRRLQEEIVRSTYDLSLLAWTPPTTTRGDYCGFLAESVSDFKGCSKMYSVTDSLLDEGEMTITNKGLRIKASEYILKYARVTHRYAVKLDCMIPGRSGIFLSIPMRKIGPNIFIRARTVDKAPSFSLVDLSSSGFNRLRTFTLLSSLPPARIPRQISSGDSPNAVSSSRFTVVQMRLPAEIAQADTEISPVKYWDAEDCAFFGTRSLLQYWGAVRLSNGVVFLCFWYRKVNDWMFRGTLLKTESKASQELTKNLFSVADEFDFQAFTVMNLLEAAQTDMASIPVVTRNGGPRWEVQIHQSREY
ncbi:hypothetical protein AK830_g9848 [Neonectria ditissima]|uniref:Uncharacterized protein n=1 Tax=Neonectria ditissima TaxID=78410 RepID=A0A0P7BBM2_9HYPO|nr:hypothetical protein AK830_g9848 [Neonectria ditissima]